MDSFSITKEYTKGKSLDDLLEIIDTQPVAMLDLNLPSQFDTWWTVSTNLGIIAYFGIEKDALSFRLEYINRLLNT